ncbi:hypothetical protein DINM_004418 [Dirofilaria immitis]|nr:hypothetical protein [Dirofilaria immitis]
MTTKANRQTCKQISDERYECSTVMATRRQGQRVNRRCVSLLGCQRHGMNAVNARSNLSREEISQWYEDKRRIIKEKKKRINKSKLVGTHSTDCNAAKKREEEDWYADMQRKKKLHSETSSFHATANLPQLPLAMFNGDPKSWRQFWSRFEAALGEGKSQIESKPKRVSHSTTVETSALSVTNQTKISKPKHTDSKKSSTEKRPCAFCNQNRWNNKCLTYSTDESRIDDYLRKTEACWKKPDILIGADYLFDSQYVIWILSGTHKGIHEQFNAQDDDEALEQFKQTIIKKGERY